MGIAGKSSEELIKELPEWKQNDFREFWAIGWRSGSKQQCVVAFDRAVKDRELSNQILAAGKRYKQLCQKNDTPLTMGSTWLNQARWETVPVVKEKENQSETCECGAPATQDTGQCDSCWADKNSKQFYNGEELPYKLVLAAKLKELNLYIRDGETREDFSNRCREEFNRRKRSSFHQ
tara:strand:- start:856 stop:1389 length:534 start_codon:yes stop_codon:yes gene_type:complete